MRCPEARRLLDLYIDSELDPKTSLEVAEHLEKCPACAERFSGEIRLEKGLGDALAKKAAAPDAALWARLEKRVRDEALRPVEPGAARRPLTRAGRSVLVAAAAVLAAAAVWAFLAAPAPLGALGRAACHSHDEYAAAREAPEVTTRSPSEVSAFFARTLGLDVRPPDAPLLEVVGARRCAFGKTHVAFVMGRRGGEPVSTFVLAARDLAAFPEARRALAGGKGPVRATIHGHDAVLATDGERVALVLASPAAEPLEPLARAFLSPR